MTNISISLDEDLLYASQEYAHQHNITLNDLIRQLLEERVRCTKATWIEACFTLMDAAGVNSVGRSWKRKDLYNC
jgi:hypothetical protein